MITLTPQQRLILIAALGSYGITDALETLGVANTPETRKRVKDQRNEIIEACEAADTIAIFTPANMLDAAEAAVVAGEMTNDRRADLGEVALLTTDYDGQDEDDRQIYMADVIANLLHLSNREGLSFDDALDGGRMHYEAEVEEADEESGGDV